MTRSHAMKRVSIISISDRMQIPTTKPKAWFGCRHAQVLLMSFGFLCCYAIRVTTSVTLEAMTNAASANPDFEEFPWDNNIKDTILSSFFWGYVCTQVIGSIIAHRWGAHILFSLAQIICGLVTLPIHVAAHYSGWEAVCASRVIAGLCQGTVLPTLHTLLAKWVPIEERGKMSTFVYAGGWIGNVICLLSSGLLADSALGWPSCFYFWGGITVISGILFFFFGKESPAVHPNIPQDEREYIETSLGITETEENGMLTSLPYLTAWIISFPISYYSDLLIKRNIFTIQTSRKVCNTIGQWIPAAALIALGYVDKEHTKIAVALLVLAVASNIAIYCGHNVNHMDLSPNFAGTLMGITNTAANICSILAPLVTSVIVKDPSNVSEWRNIFFLSAVIYILGNLMFILFGTSKIQKWNDPVEKKKDTGLNGVTESSVENGYSQKMKDIESVEI
ncbi:putative inorganic phosphate cotransporter isoform X2 [Andrena cerasifolii]|uniref:putative inorganic phosphate cotransporter isoform X2 n=1 Tax=Andrena cerasifolii TaxID=2819439 RepID=UPI0040384A0E